MAAEVAQQEASVGAADRREVGADCRRARRGAPGSDTSTTYDGSHPLDTAERDYSTAISREQTLCAAVR